MVVKKAKCRWSRIQEALRKIGGVKKGIVQEGKTREWKLKKESSRYSKKRAKSY